MIKLGDKVSVKPSFAIAGLFGNGHDEKCLKMLTGTVVYIHPFRPWFTVEFDFSTKGIFGILEVRKVRESFWIEEGQ